jgi:hypothetical protein
VVSQKHCSLLDWKQPSQWDNELEIQDWDAALEWLRDKCTFCARRELRLTDISHTLRECKRSGKRTITKGLSDMLYDESFLPDNSCKIYYLFYSFCSQWEKVNSV